MSMSAGGLAQHILSRVARDVHSFVTLICDSYVEERKTARPSTSKLERHKNTQKYK
jgi:hypothetical protein